MFKDSLGFRFLFSSYHLSSQCYRNSLLLSRPIQIQWLARIPESWKELFVSLWLAISTSYYVKSRLHLDQILTSQNLLSRIIVTFYVIEQ